MSNSRDSDPTDIEKEEEAEEPVSVSAEMDTPHQCPAGTASPQGEAKNEENEENSSAYDGEGTLVPVRTIQEDSASAAAETDGTAAEGAENGPRAKRIKPSSVVAVVLSSLLCLFAVFVFIYAVSARLGNKQVELFGVSFSIVVTDSMTPEIQVGDLVVVKKCDISEVEVGQNVVFTSLSVSVDGEAIKIIHRVMEVGEDEEGIYLVTQGVKYGTTLNKDYVDKDYVRADNLIGTELFHSTVLGNIVAFLSKPQNWILIALLVVLCFFAYKQAKKIIKYVKENKSDKKE